MVYPPGDLNRFAGATALVTGASSGIGTAVATSLARSGLRVVLTARRADRLESLAEKLRADRAEVLVVPADARKETELIGVFDRVRATYGGVDVLVNNAGLGRSAPLMEGKTEDWREMLEVNVLALCICTREAIADMRSRDRPGHVFHIASMASYRVPPGTGAAYAATKHAVRALTEGLRQELRAQGSSIRVTAVSPGFVETEFATVFAHGDPGAAARTYGRFRVLTPEDVASAVLYALAAPDRMEVHDVLMRPTAQET